MKATLIAGLVLVATQVGVGAQDSLTAAKAYDDLVVFKDFSLHVERGDRIALVGPNGVGKSTLMRMLSGEEAPDTGDAREGHNVVMQYFAQDEATRMDPAPTVYETLASGSPHAHGADDPQYPGRLPVFRRRHLQASAACCRAASARGWRWRECCCVRRTRCCSTSRPTTSISIPRKSCSTRWWTTAAR